MTIIHRDFIAYKLYPATPRAFFAIFIYNDDDNEEKKKNNDRSIVDG